MKPQIRKPVFVFILIMLSLFSAGIYLESKRVEALSWQMDYSLLRYPAKCGISYSVCDTARMPDVWDCSTE